jgi:hypothetical protein
LRVHGLRALAETIGTTARYLESWRKLGGVAALRQVARALGP